MSSENCNSPRVHGRLNLEQQRKRAKELLKQTNSGDATARERLRQSLTQIPEEPKLSDAQRVVALEAGFPSWPRLKHHIEALEFAQRNIGVSGDQDMPTLHIRCGSDIQQGLKIAGFQGDFLEFADPFCTGPVPELPLEAHLRSRARFLATAFELDEDDALACGRREYAALESLGDYGRIVLWFEHDSYDQLILAYLLMRLAEAPPGARLELIAVDHVPGVERFIGIGQLSPELLGWLWEQRIEVNDDLLRLGSEAWSAITAPTPEPLFTLASGGTPPLPMMAPALLRHLRELPDSRGGLGLTERLTLEIARDLGPHPLGRAFGKLMREREPLPFLGDIMFRWVAHTLTEGEHPALSIEPPARGEPWFRAVMTLTPLGERLLAGQLNRLDLEPAERWVGGTVTPGEGGSWCWDETHGKPRWRPI